VITESIVPTAKENFDARGYLDYNQDVARAYSFSEARKHFLDLGINENRLQYNYATIREARKRKSEIRKTKAAPPTICFQRKAITSLRFTKK
jgi:hypothetical protein